jgi:hypothetical protein
MELEEVRSARCEVRSGKSKVENKWQNTETAKKKERKVNNILSH